MKTLVLLLAGLLLAGLLLASPAARAQWVLQPFAFANSTAPYSPSVSAFSIASPQAVWAVGTNQQLINGFIDNYGDNEVARTADGGATWTVSTVPGVDFYNEIFDNIIGLSASTALICTNGYSGATTTNGRILKTVDGGATWTTQTTSSQVTSSSSYLDFFFFFSGSEGICVGDPVPGSSGLRFELYRTLDAGTTWATVNTVAMPAALAGETAYAFYSAQVGDNAWFTTSAGRVFRTADRGQTWAVSATGLPSYSAISFRDAANGLTFGRGGLARTTDGGATWRLTTYAGPLHQLLVHVPGTSTYLAAGQGPDAGSSYSRDDGATWTALETTRSHFALAAYSATTAWSGAVSYSPTAPAGLGAYKLATTVLGTRAATLAGGTLSVYPNPSPNGQPTVTLAAGTPLAEAWLSVFDALGRCVHAEPVAAATSQLSLGRPLAPGLYTVQLRTSQGVAQQPLVVQ